MRKNEFNLNVPRYVETPPAEEELVLEEAFSAFQKLAGLIDVALRYYPNHKTSELALLKDDILLERSGGGPDQPVGRVVLLRDDLLATHPASYLLTLSYLRRARFNGRY